jgi:hypothetical protein
LKFIKYNNAFILVEKTADSSFKKYESSATEIYAEKDGKFEVKQ